MQRMHIIKVEFPVGTSLAKIQTAYDDGFVMPDGAWRRTKIDPPIVEISAVLDDLPIEHEIESLKQGLREFVSPNFTILSVGPEIDHYDLDPCFNHA